jgi:hypothetical protein
VSGAAVLIGILPSKAALDALKAILGTSGSNAFTVEDPSGGVIAEITGEGEAAFQGLRISGRLPMRSVLGDELQTLLVGAGVPYQWTDGGDGVLGEVDANGALSWAQFSALVASLGAMQVPGGSAGTTLAAEPGKLAMHGMTMLPSALPGLTFENEWGEVFFALDGSAIGGGTSTDGGDYNSALRARLNTQGAAYSASLRNTPVHAWRGLLFDVCQFVLASQSFGTAQGSYPVLTRAARYGNVFMLGNSPRAAVNGTSTTAWAPAGGVATYTPLREVTQDANTGAILTDAEEAALARDTVALGETMMSAFLYGFARLRMARRDLAVLDRALVGTVTGISGKSLALLSKGASPELFNRNRDAVSAVRNSGDRAGRSHGVPAVAMDQGQYDSTNMASAQPTKAGYRPLLNAYDDDLAATVIGLTGQADRPLFMLFQIGGSWARDNAAGTLGTVDVPNALGVPMAQLEFALEREHAVMVGPDYPVMDLPSGHLTANGERQLGAQLAKVLDRIAAGERHEPCRPLRWGWRGRTITGVFHTPRGALRIKPCYSGLALASFPGDAGLTVWDASGRVPLLSVEVAGSNLLSWAAGRDIVAPAYALLGTRTYHAGVTNICDSDPAVADDLYVYQAGTDTTGQYPAENVPELVGKPLTLENWSVIGVWPITDDTALT